MALLEKLRAHGCTYDTPDTGDVDGYVPAATAPARTPGREKASAQMDAPYSLIAEQGVLGALLVDNSTFDQISDALDEADFFKAEHRQLYGIIAQLIAHSEVADLVTVSEAAEDLGKAVDFDYLAQLIQNTPSISGARHYAKIVRDKAVLRETLALCEQTVTSIQGRKGESSTAIIEHLQSKAFDISDRQSRQDAGLVPAKTIMTRVVEGISSMLDRDDALIGVSTGLDDVDAHTSGLRDTDMIIVAGRPAMGKTTFALNIAEHVALEEKLPVAVFSLEMGAEQLGMRFVSSIARIQQDQLLKGKLTEDEWVRVSMAVNKISDAPLFIDDTPGISTMEVRARARRLMRSVGKLGLVVIDYLQLMTASGRHDNRVGEVSYISRMIKALAKELKCPVVALSQLSRKVEERSDKRPTMADLRESGAIEQDADMVMFLYRDEYYNPDSEFKGQAELIFGKFRNGATGTVRLAFAGENTRFSNYYSGEY